MKRRAASPAVAMVLLTGFAVANARDARAQGSPLPSPDVCAADNRTLHAYQAGWRGGQSLVALATHGTCDNLPEVERVVSDALSRMVVSKGASDFVRCRVRGLNDGADAALADLHRTCADGGP